MDFEYFEHFEYEKIQTNEGFLAYFDNLLEEIQRVLKNTKDEDLEKPWSMRHRETVCFFAQKANIADFLYESLGPPSSTIGCLFAVFGYCGSCDQPPNKKSLNNYQ